MNRIKDILYAIALIIVILFAIYALARVPKAHGQSLSPKTKTLELNSWQGLDSIKALDDTLIFFSEGTFTQLGWVTDSIKWVAIDTTFKGDEICIHDWVYDEPNIFQNTNILYGCTAIHSGDHCSLDDAVREKICRVCLRSVIEREQWFQHYVAPPKTEFQRLKEKQRAKQ